MISRAYFKESSQLRRNEKMSDLKISDDLFLPFLVIYSIFTFQPLTTRCRYNHTRAISSSLSFIIQSTFSKHFSVFTPLFHSRTSKFTTTTAQLPFYNCKLHFTISEIVISCTLKYALMIRIYAWAYKLGPRCY